MAKNGISTISWNTCRLVSWQLLLLLPPRLRLSKRRETRRVENISMMELFRFSLKKFLSSDGILVYLLMALRCGISRLGATNLLNFCYIQKFSKPFLFTSHRNILNPKLELICIENISQYLICVYLVANYFSKEKKVFTYIQVFRFSERCTLC